MLPISVLVPTRNSISLLPRHIEAMRPWLDLAAEVVAVDSHSTDGTLELLQREFGARGRVLTHPPGLYQSWNFGISECREPFVYVSTVGDHISRVGLEKLFSAGSALRADIVVSPPRMVDEQGNEVRKVWPIHALIEALALRQPVAFDADATQLFAVTNLRRGILGSSASNLYRTELLKQHPFRTDFGTAGDLAWGLEHGGKVKLAIVPEPFATFTFHRKSYSKTDYAVADFAGRSLALARQAVNPTGRNASSIEQLLNAWDQFLAAKNAVNRAKERPMWYARPGAWRAHWSRSAALRDLSALQARATDLLRQQMIAAA